MMSHGWLVLAGALVVTATSAPAAVPALAAPAAASSGDQAFRMVTDRQAIEALLAQYSTGLDTLNPDLYASCFTDDAELVQGDTVRKGRAEIRKVITDLIESRNKRAAAAAASTPGAEVPPNAMHHVITNGVIDLIDTSDARHRSYWMTILGRAGGKFDVAAMGRYEDVLVKQDGKWLFRQRKILR